MPYALPERLRALTPYSYRREGFVCRLDINESFIQPPQAVREAIARRVAALPLTEYPDSYADGVRALLARRYAVSQDETVVSNGSDELISMLFGRFLRSGDTVLTPEMDFSGYQACAAIFGQTLRLLPRDETMGWSADAMIAALAEQRPDMLIFSNPSNPVGRVLPRAEVLRVLDAAGDCLAVADEAYMDFCPGQSVIDCIRRYPNLIVLKTLSKAYGLAGVRVGFAFANAELARALQASRDVYNVSALSQIAAEEVLGCPEHLAFSAAEMRRTVAMLADGLGAMRGRKRDLLAVYPSDANFLLIRVADAHAVRAAVAERGYALRVFSDSLIRISAASEAHTRELLSIFEAVLQ